MSNDREHCTGGNKTEKRQRNKPLTKADFKQRYAVLTGSLAKGFFMDEIVLGDEAAKAAVLAHAAPGEICDAVPVGWPSDLEESASDAYRMKGTTYLMLTSGATGVSSGIELYGPFRDEDDAGKFGQRNRSDDGNWEVMELLSATEMSDLL